MAFTIIATVDAEGGIDKGGVIPWGHPETLSSFSEETTRSPQGKVNAIIMGRKTFGELPPHIRPLPGRHTFVLSRKGAIA